MNIYKHELKTLLKSTIIWALSMTALALIYFSVFPGIAEDAEEFKKLLGGYSPSIRALLSISLDNITSILGFYSMIFSFITLCGAIQAMNYGMSVLSRETRERTADFLLVKPVSRSKIVSAKVLAAFTMLLFTDALYYVSAFVMANLVKTSDYSNKLFLMLNLTLLFIQLIFLAVGLLVSVFFNKLKTVLPVSLGVVFGFYILGALLVTGENVAARYFAPFKYFDYNYILKNGSFDGVYLVISALIIAAAVTASYLIYTKKDIHAVS